VQIQFQYSPASDPHFSADTQFPPVIQPGGSANVTVPLFCFPGTPVGEYSLGFTVVTLDGSTTLGSTGIVVSVVGPSVTTVIDPAFASVTMTTGGITPINLNLTSRGGNASVSFELQGTTPGLSLSGPPISVIEGNPTKGTVWINAAMDAPAQATVTLVQHAFNGSQMEALSPSIALSILPPALQGFPPLSFEDFFIVRVYWGQRWIDGDPFSWTDMEAAIVQLMNGAYVRGMREYGVGTVHTSGHPLAVAVDGDFIPSGQFDNSDVTNLITELIDSDKLPAPGDISSTPLYVVFPPRFSKYKPDPTGVIGWNGSFQYQGTDQLFAWVYQGGDVPGTTPGFGHEVAEALCAKRAGIQVGDPCQLLKGNCDGIAVQAFLSQQRNLCIIPDMTGNSDVAATKPVPNKTGS
jgi:hypothetical protein